MMKFGRISRLLVTSGNEVVRCNTRRAIATCTMNRKESWPKEKFEWRINDKEWAGFFHYFQPEKGISIDIIHALQKPIDISPSSIKRWYQKFKRTKAIFDQTYNEDRVMAVGCELAAAHFIVYRGGKVQQKGSSNWIEMDKDEEYDLPRHVTPGFFVESIDASGTELRYEGLECLGNLDYLKWLDVSNCSNMDDWCVDRICGQYGNTLEYLNLSNCTAITERGIAALCRLRTLKTLNITGLHNISNIKLLCLLIEDVIPDIEIIGVDYMNYQSAQSS